MTRMIPLHSVSSQAEIELRAQELFEMAGRPPGRDLDHWLQAEADHRERLPFFSSGRPAFTDRGDCAFFL